MDSTTRQLELDSKEKILISDTVGFIRKLPAHLVASFKSTLNEVRDSDIILNVVDLSHPFFEEHLKVVEDTLNEFGSENKILLKVFNKVDAVAEKGRIEYVKNYYKDSVVISASKGINVPALKKKLKSVVENAFAEEQVNLNINQSKVASQIYQLAEVISTKYDEDIMTISYRANKQNSDKIKKIIHGS